MGTRAATVLGSEARREGVLVNREDVIRMAREVDLHERVKDGVGYVVRIPNLEKLERFAALVAAAEREACAKVAESYEPTCDTCPSGVANAIRARGEA